MDAVITPAIESVELEGHAETTADSVSRLIINAVSGALTGLFALAGAFTGAITGAVAGRASRYGVLRGAGIGAIAGAVLSVEVLEASRAYWCLELSGLRGPSSMADFVEQLLHERFVNGPSTFHSYHWQVRVGDNISYGERDEIYGEVVPMRGLSGESLKKLPCYIMSDDILKTQNFCCTICLQEIETGEITRSLPNCHHTFHLVCVDKWLIRHGSCPVCRQAL